ncbi:MAG: hypothetical protein FWG37_00610 [Clostridia bacterium]|nr:hypothetical protein [Clostridia bacterium]
MRDRLVLERLSMAANQRGNKLAVLSADRLADVKQDFDALGVDTSPYYRFEPRNDLGFMARSVIAVASPGPVSSVAFTVEGRKRVAVIPPSYVDADIEESALLDFLLKTLGEHSFAVARADRLPCKPIAIHAGLGFFGRNNLVYVDSMGSFNRLSLFFSDIPCPNELFFPLLRHGTCRHCSRCIDNCPTGALNHQSALFDADHCLTMANEGAEAFPDWVNPEWHHAIVGCMKCQCVCPMNEPYGKNCDVITTYNEEQTRVFMDGEQADELLSPLGLGHYNKILPRNIAALLRL